MLYGNDCLLTKHSLFFKGEGSTVELFPHVHFVNRAAVADVYCTMLHYKLTANALVIARQNKERFTTNAKSYGDFIGILTSSPDFRIHSASARRLNEVNDLIEAGYLVVSDKYRRHVESVRRSRSEEAYQVATIGGKGV